MNLSQVNINNDTVTLDPVTEPQAVKSANNDDDYDDKTSAASSSNDSRYTIKGTVKYPDGKPVSGIKIQVMDSDQEAFQDHNDDIIDIVSVNDSNGIFEATFDPSAFKDGWLEGRPDIYLIVRNALDGQVLYKTEIRKAVKQDSSDLIFNITVNSIEEGYDGATIQDNNSTLYDPFQGNIDRVIAAFTRLGDIVQFVPNDIHRNFALLVSAINAWSIYTQEDMWRKIGYDGPQVPRYPWRDQRHSHKLSWAEA
jgi:hypothetical protein